MTLDSTGPERKPCSRITSAKSVASAEGLARASRSSRSLAPNAVSTRFQPSSASAPGLLSASCNCRNNSLPDARARGFPAFSNPKAAAQPVKRWPGCRGSFFLVHVLERGIAALLHAPDLDRTVGQLGEVEHVAGAGLEIGRHLRWQLDRELGAVIADQHRRRPLDA